jgi:predicted ATPase
VSGEPGIGKSRLAQTLLERLSGEPHTRLRFFCSPHHQDSALYPTITQLERAAGFRREDTAEQRLDKLEAVLAQATNDLGEAAPLLAALLSLPVGDRHPPLNLTPQKQKERTLQALVAQVQGLAARQPVVMLFEDAQWSDPTSLELFDLIIDRAPALPLLLIITFRPEFSPPWTGRPHVTSRSLNRLTPRQRTEMIAGVTGGKALPEEIAAQIIDRTDGVPLFVEELTKAVVESGILTDTGNRFNAAGPVVPLAVPASLQASLLARLDRLAPAREVAQIGAALGRQFSHELLSAVAPMPPAQLDEALWQLVASELVYRRGTPPDAEYTFKHALVQDAAYSTLLRGRRQHLHTRIAVALEERFPGTVESQPELLAHHCTEAGLSAMAVRYWQRAGERATQRSALVEAIAHLTKGLETLKTLPETPEHTQQALTLYTALGAALVMAKGLGVPEVEHAYIQAHALCQQVGETPELVPVLYGLYRFYLGRLQLHTAREIGETLLRLAQRAEDPALAVIAHYALGTTWLFFGALPAARLHLEEAIARYTPDQHRAPVFRMGQDRPAFLSTADGDPGVGCRIHAALLLWLLGYPEQALARLHEALALAHELPHPYSLAHARCWAAYVYQFRWDVPAVHEQAEAAVALSIEQGFPFWAAAGTILRGWALAMQGQGEAGMAQVCQGIAAYRATEAPLLVAYYCTLLAEVSAHLGHPEDGLQALVEAHTLMEQQEERYWEAEVCRLRGVLLLRQPGASQAEAEACFQQALDVARRQEAKSLELRAAMSLARLWQQQCKRAAAYELLAPIYGWFTEGFDTADLKDAKALLAELA